MFKRTEGKKQFQVFQCKVPKREKSKLPVMMDTLKRYFQGLLLEKSEVYLDKKLEEFRSKRSHI